MKLTVRSYDPGALSVEYYQRLSAFVKHQLAESPLPTNWTPDLLSLCTISIVSDGEYIAAVAWHHPVPQLHPGGWMFHAVAAEKYRRRWLSRRVLREIFYPPEVYGATRLYAQVTTPEVRAIWARLGFELIDDPDHGELAYKDAM